MRGEDYEPVPVSDSPPGVSESTAPSTRKGSLARGAIVSFLAFSVIALLLYSFTRKTFPLQPLYHLDTDQDLTLPERQPEDLKYTINSMSGMRQVGYFTNWGIYGRRFPPSMVPAQYLTHILYAFANLRAATGEVFLSDEWSDKDIHYPGDSWDEPNTNLFGNFKQFMLMKRRHRHLKLLLSIGGWAYSASFDPVVVSPKLRANFVATAVRFVEDYGLDGLDIDYEYPKNDLQAQGFLELIRELRLALDALERRIGAGRFSLTVAAPCGVEHYRKLYLREMDSFLDFWNLMAYDYAGSWDSIANHQANVLGHAINTTAAVQYYHENGQIPRNKLVIGIPLYGRSFLSCAGSGTPFRGVGQGSWEAGVYDYRSLPLPGSTVYHDREAIASYSFDPTKGEMISFDDAATAHAKAEWITRSGLGGAMYWEISGDKDLGPRDGMEDGEGKREVPGPSLIKVVSSFFTRSGPGLDNTPNRLNYPTSRFPNVRQGF